MSATAGSVGRARGQELRLSSRSSQLVATVLLALAGLGACDGTERCRGTRVVMIVDRDGTPLCDASLQRVAASGNTPLDTTATCRAVYEVNVDGNVELQAAAPGFAPKQLKLSPVRVNDNEPCRARACALLVLEPVP